MIKQLTPHQVRMLRRNRPELSLTMGNADQMCGPQNLEWFQHGPERRVIVAPDGQEVTWKLTVKDDRGVWDSIEDWRNSR